MNIGQAKFASSWTSLEPLKFNGLRTGRVQGGLGYVLFLLAMLILSPPDARAHGDKPHAERAPDTAASADVTAQVLAFTEALDSVYTSIGGTYLGIEPVLRASCYNCHSGQVRYPWYYKIPGIRGMIDNDIAEARKHLDMDKGFPFGGHTSQENQLLEIREEIASGGMPPLSYRLLHWGAGLNDTERDSVFAWIDSSMSSIRALMKSFGVEPPDASARTVYVCPMDPEVVSSKPGTCPKCGMDLEELSREPAAH